jgi:hypothetical protein
MKLVKKFKSTPSSDNNNSMSLDFHKDHLSADILLNLVTQSLMLEILSLSEAQITDLTCNQDVMMFKGTFDVKYKKK